MNGHFFLFPFSYFPFPFPIFLSVKSPPICPHHRHIASFLNLFPLTSNHEQGPLFFLQNSRSSLTSSPALVITLYYHFLHKNILPRLLQAG